MKLPSAILLLSFLINNFVSFGQQAKLDALDNFSGSLIRKLRESEGEKACLVTDKSIYGSGQTIWFRTFLLRSVSDKISTKSEYLFVDLVDEKDTVLQRSLLNAREQQTGGKLKLPDTLPTGPYWVRAYTKAMINGNAKDAAVVPIYIINPMAPVAAHTSERSNAGEDQLFIEMFPEGGSLITGINTSVGFSLHDKVGNPVSLSGQIKDNRDSVVANFTTNNFGLAKAAFFPFFNRKYKAVASYKNKEYAVPLPSFNRFAGQLAVLGRADNVLRLQTVLEDSIYRKDALTYLVGISKDSLCFASIGYGSYETAVSLSAFPKGIATFLLFDEKFKLLSERRFYVRQEHLNTKADLDKEVYAKRSKAVLTASVLSKSNQPVPASLTVTVSDSSALLDQDVIAANSLARKGREIGLSNWDLLRLTSLSDEDIDLLLLNSRPFYNEAIAQTKKSEEATDDLFSIKGKLLNEKGSPLPNQSLNLISKTGNGVFVVDTTDAAGRFLFPLPPYQDSTQFSLQMNAARGRTEPVKILLDNFRFPHFETPSYLKTKFVLPATRRSAYLRRYSDTTDIKEDKGMLERVSVNAKSKLPYESAGRPVLSSSVLTSEQLMKLGTGNIGIGLLRMPGVQLLNGLVEFYGPGVLPGQAGGASPEPIVLLDGNPVSLGAGTGGNSPLISYLNSLNPREIDYIEVFKGPEASMFGLRGGNGVVYIHSASQVHQDFAPGEGNAYKFYRQGYAKPAEFPLTTYDEKGNKDFSFTDVRSTLYWNENELVDANGKSVFAFFTNDVPGHYKVAVTGITSRGDLIYKTLSFTNK